MKLDRADRSSHYCVLDESGRIPAESKAAISAKAIDVVFRRSRSRIALETGTHSPWVSRLLSTQGMKPSWRMRAACGRLAKVGGETIA